MKKMLLMLVLLLFNYGCSSNKINRDTKQNIENMNHTGLYDIWGLKHMNGKAINASKGMILELNTSKNSFLGNGGCNNIAGSLEFGKENSISFKNTRATRMACQDLNIEQEYLKNLENVRSYKTKNLHLLLFDKEGELLLDYIKID